MRRTSRARAGILAELGPEHFDDPCTGALRDHLVQPGEVDPSCLACWPSSTRARRPRGSTSRRRKQLLLRLRERRLERELDEADLERTKELQAALARVRDAVREFA